MTALYFTRLAFLLALLVVAGVVAVLALREKR